MYLESYDVADNMETGDVADSVACRRSRVALHPGPGRVWQHRSKDAGSAEASPLPKVKLPT